MGAANTLLIPKSELAPGQAAAIRNAAIAHVLRMASVQTKLAEERLVVRDIRPDEDLGYSLEDWRETTSATADAYETMDTGTNADQRWIGIYGVKDDGDNLSVSQIRLNVGGADMAIWNLQSLTAGDDFVGLSPAVVVIPPNAPWTFSRFVRSPSATSNLVLKGFIVEPRGKVVSP